MRRKVVFSPEARADLFALYDYIAGQASPTRAMRYIERIESHCAGFDYGKRGMRRDDLRPGLRVVGFERRVTIAFHLDRRTVTIDRIFYAGRDVERALRKPDETAD